MGKTVQKRSVQEKKCLLYVNMLFPPSRIFVRKRTKKWEMLERRYEPYNYKFRDETIDWLNHWSSNGCTMKDWCTQGRLLVLLSQTHFLSNRCSCIWWPRAGIKVRNNIQWELVKVINTVFSNVTCSWVSISFRAGRQQRMTIG